MDAAAAMTLDEDANEDVAVVDDVHDAGGSDALRDEGNESRWGRPVFMHTNQVL